MQLLVAVLLAAAAPAASPPADLDALIDRLQASYDHLDSLEADFVQVLESVALGEAQEEHGHLYLRRPALMRWEYRSPEEKLAIVDGQRTYLYIPAENQVIIGTLDEVRRSGAAGLLLAGRVWLREDFRIEIGERAAGTITFHLTPREATEEFESIDLTVSSDQFVPARILVNGSVGDRMEYRLSNVRTGIPLDPSLFRFDVPEGVELVLAE